MRFSVLKKQNKVQLYTYGEEVEIDFIDNITRDNKPLMKKFKSENKHIENFIRSISYKDYNSVSYISYDKKLNNPISILTISCSGIYIDKKRKFANKIDVISAIEIKYFAVNECYRHLPMQTIEGTTLSNLLFAKHLKNVYKIAKNICGARKIILYAVPKAYNFYTRFGFSDFKDYMIPNKNTIVKDCLPMFLSLDNKINIRGI